MTTKTVGTTAALTTALKSAVAGDTILLAPGTYSAATINGLHFATDVTIASQSSTSKAVLTGLTVTYSSGLSFKGLEFKVGTTDNPFQVGYSQDIHFSNLSIHGSLDGNAANDKAAFLVRSSSDVSIENSEFQQLSGGFGHLNSTNIKISGNSFHDIVVDGVRGGGSSYVTISNNEFYDFYPKVGVHPDAIQFWTTNTAAAAHDIVITNNAITRGHGETAQGIFIGDETDVMPYKNVTISGNLVSGAAYNGIMVSHASNVKIANNVVQGFSDEQSWVRAEEINGGSMSGNTANTYVTKLLSSFTQSLNKTIATATDGGAAAEKLWISLTGGITGGTSGGSAPVESPTSPTTPTSPTSPVTTGKTLVGTSGADVLTGTSYADTFSGGAGADKLTGGAGNDLYITTGSSTVVEAAGGGIDTVRSSTSFTLNVNVENLELTGTTAQNGSGNASNNYLLGNGIANSLSGRDGADTINGGAGADTIAGGLGNDQLIGGTGADRFKFGLGDGDNVIKDFGLNGEHDVLDLSTLYGAGLRATMHDATAGVTLSFANGDSIMLSGVHPSQLHATSTGFVF